MENIYAKLAKLKLSSGKAKLLPTDLNSEGMQCVSTADFSSYLFKSIQFECLSDGFSPMSLEATVLSCSALQGAYNVNLGLEQSSLERLNEVFKRMIIPADASYASGSQDAPRARAGVASRPNRGTKKTTAAEEEVVPTIEYYVVPLELYRGEEKIETDLYMYYQSNYILLKSKGSPWLEADTKKLSEFGINELYMKFPSRKEHHLYLEDKLAGTLNRSNVSTEKKALVLYELADPILATVYTTPQSAESIQAASNLVKSTIKYMNEQCALPELVELSSRNLTEHAHSLHISAYAVALGKKLGIRAYNEVLALGMGGLLHDIGKSKIDNKIIEKPGELNDEEWQLVRQHPKIGDEILRTRAMIPTAAKRVVVEHHERINGKGYPVGLKNTHLFSRIVSIADVFNTIVAKKPYGTPLKPFDALKKMVDTMHPEFDSKLLKAFIEMMS